MTLKTKAEKREERKEKRNNTFSWIARIILWFAIFIFFLVSVSGENPEVLGVLAILLFAELKWSAHRRQQVLRDALQEELQKLRRLATQNASDIGHLKARYQEDEPGDQTLGLNEIGDFIGTEEEPSFDTEVLDLTADTEELPRS